MYGVSSMDTSWSLQQQLVTTDLRGGPVGFLDHTLFANGNDTLNANFTGPLQSSPQAATPGGSVLGVLDGSTAYGTGLSYIFRTARKDPTVGTPGNLIGTWSLHQMLSGLDMLPPGA